MSESRWVDEFAAHPFQARWTQIKELLSKTTVDDQTVTTSVYELARLKRVVTYIDEIISNIDPELTPRGIWASFQQQAESLYQQVAAYESNRNIGHINNANENTDNLLTYVRPYMVVPEAAIKALKHSALSYSRELGNYLDAFREKSVSITTQLSKDRETSTESLIEIETNKTRVKQYTRQIFEGEDSFPSIKDQIQTFLLASSENERHIREFHASLLIGTTQEPSIQTSVKTAEAEILLTQQTTSKLLVSTQGEVDELEAFHQKIFGKKDAAGTILNPGLESELTERVTELVSLENEQKIKHKAMFDQIESLLPGATSAGLATAYENLKNSFKEPIDKFTKFFYWSLIGLGFAAFVMAIKDVSLVPIFAINFVDVPEWDVILKALIYKVPFIAPVVWLALFSATRRSQYERLQQEYAHKEALARSYESYKKQLLDLKGDSEDLQKVLISKAIDSIAYNASVTLDGKHEEKLPAQKILEVFNVDELKKLVDLAKTFSSKS